MRTNSRIWVGFMLQPSWIVVRTHPNAESIAIYHLQRQSFDYYQPLILERKHRKGTLRDCVSPLFPCYLFVQIISQWTCLQSTHGIAAVLKMGPTPAKVPEQVIAELRKRENSSGVVVLPKQRFEVGDKVKIQDDIFNGELALIDRMPAKDRQKVLLTLLSSGYKVSVEEGKLVSAA